MESNDKNTESGRDRVAVERNPVITQLEEAPVEILPIDRTACEMTTERFRISARVISDIAAGGTLEVPTFRSPPRSAALDRSISRRRGGPVVSVRRRNRPIEAIQADLIEGVVVANRLDPVVASAFRRNAWAALNGVVAERSTRTQRSTSPAVLVEPQSGAHEVGVSSTTRDDVVTADVVQVVDLTEHVTAA